MQCMDICIYIYKYIMHRIMESALCNGINQTLIVERDFLIYSGVWWPEAGCQEQEIDLWHSLDRVKWMIFFSCLSVIF
jgi:hypothetical protein